MKKVNTSSLYRNQLIEGYRRHWPDASKQKALSIGAFQMRMRKNRRSTDLINMQKSGLGVNNYAKVGQNRGNSATQKVQYLKKFFFATNKVTDSCSASQNLLEK